MNVIFINNSSAYIHQFLFLECHIRYDLVGCIFRALSEMNPSNKVDMGLFPYFSAHQEFIASA